MKGKNKPKEHMETQLISFDTHRGLSQSERTNVCEHIVKILVYVPFLKMKSLSVYN